MRRSPEFSQWTGTHAGVFTTAIALSCGISEKRLRTARAREEVVSFRSAWILADAPRTVEANAWAALLRTGGPARITGGTCLWMHGLKFESDQVSLSVPANTHRSLDDVVMLRDRNRTGGASRVAGYPAVSRQRAIVDGLRIADSSDGRAILHESLRLGWISAGELRGWCEKLSRHRGIVNLRAQAAYAASGSRAESERALARIISSGQLIGWKLNVPIHDGAQASIGIGDCVHDELRIVVEIDGMAWHTSSSRFQRDRTRQNALINAGWHVLRFTWADVNDRPDRVLTEIRAAIDRRRVAS